MFEKNKLEIAVNILYTKNTETLPANISIHNSARGKQIILVIISKEENEKEGRHYLAVKKLSALLCRKTSNHDNDFYCLNYLNSFRTESKLKWHEKTWKDKTFCSIEMPSEKTKILKLNQQTKLDKMAYAIYAEIERLVKKIDSCENNPQISSTTN